MQGDFKVFFRPTSTGIMVEVRDESGQCVAYREVSAALMQHYVADHADRNAAIGFDNAIGEAMRRTDDSLNHTAAQIAFIQRIANGVEEIAV